MRVDSSDELFCFRTFNELIDNALPIWSSGCDSCWIFSLFSGPGRRSYFSRFRAQQFAQAVDISVNFLSNNGLLGCSNNKGKFDCLYLCFLKTLFLLAFYTIILRRVFH